MTETVISAGQGHSGCSVLICEPKMIEYCSEMVDFLRDVGHQEYGNAIQLTFSNPQRQPTYNLAFHIGTQGIGGSWKYPKFCPFCGQKVRE